ncbi:hypothetical protein [Stenotrophomonas sp. DR009]|uniref:hypothetical protein n=1 Tax=Stenotrophomonas sp. DR009 TaxID=3398461 RepID=UPI003BB0BB6B
MDVEQRARERLAAAYKATEYQPMVYESKGLIHGRLDRREKAAVEAIIAALTPPAGFVLVPVELPVEMEIAFMEAWVSKRRCIDDPEMQDAWEAALAARPDHIAHDLKMVAGRPEVKP